MSEIGVIHEQGDYGIFNHLNKEDQRKAEVNERSRAMNESAHTGKSQEIRLGDCSHLDRK